MFMDLHGHSILKNSFIYGPSETDFQHCLSKLFLIQWKNCLFICGTSQNISKCLHVSLKVKGIKFRLPECTFKLKKTSSPLLVKIP